MHKLAIMYRKRVLCFHDVVSPQHHVKRVFGNGKWVSATKWVSCSGGIAVEVLKPTALDWSHVDTSHD